MNEWLPNREVQVLHHGRWYPALLREWAPGEDTIRVYVDFTVLVDGRTGGWFPIERVDLRD